MVDCLVPAPDSPYMPSGRIPEGTDFLPLINPFKSSTSWSTSFCMPHALFTGEKVVRLV